MLRLGPEIACRGTECAPTPRLPPELLSRESFFNEAFQLRPVAVRIMPCPTAPGLVMQE